ncbi:MAG TPA: aspartyl protease family protein [Anaerolineae bacterium]|nr:aspartyl protease family protein [Anaerolineae bacterium]MCB0225876.1 aspartyl protease family protein [Anaerolineae bacterium]HRV92787.1 aspartyl protease family protein [Anaerolineae bacterium]
MKIDIVDELPFITVLMHFRGRQLVLDHVLLDTGSAGTVFAVDQVETIDLLPEPGDPIRQIRGVGGSEFVFSKRIERLVVGELEVSDFEIEVGAMKYGFALNGIIGLDFLLQTKAMIDLDGLEIYRPGH